MNCRSVLILSLMLVTLSAIGQQYNANVPTGKPNPLPPPSPEDLNMKAPEAITVQGSIGDDQSQGYIQSTQIPTMANPLGIQYVGPATYPAIVPTKASSINNFYVSSSSQTSASCYLYGSLPLWMSIGAEGPCWTYEWYPNGRLVTQYIGNFFPGWYKGWGVGDAPGWHVMQYYCTGWSNYIYIYVYPYENYYKNYRPSIINPTPSPLTPPPSPRFPLSTPFSEYSIQMPLPEYPAPSYSSA